MTPPTPAAAGSRLAADLRTHLDTHARLRSHVTGDFDAAADRDAAGALMSFSLGLGAMRSTLADRRVSQTNRETIESVVAVRAARVLLERFWENPRRRRGGHPVLSRKFAYGGLWSPAAAAPLIAGGPPGSLRLEHVVPASTIVAILAAAAAAGRSSEDGSQILAELITHVVTTPGDNATLAPLMSDENAAKLFAHYDGTSPMDEQDLSETRWSRYLDAAEAGTLAFDLGALQTLSSQLPPRP